MYILKKKQIVAPYSDWLSRAELKNDIVDFTQDKYIDPATHILHGISILVPMPFVMVNESGNILYAAISYSGLLGCMGAWVLQCFSIELQATPNQNFKLNMEVWKMILPNFKGVSNFQVPSQIFGWITWMHRPHWESVGNCESLYLQQPSTWIMACTFPSSQSPRQKKILSNLPMNRILFISFLHRILQSNLCRSQTFWMFSTAMTL